MENLIIRLESPWKPFFDAMVLLVTAYSCFTTVWLVSFSQTSEGMMKIIDDIVTIIFAFDLVFNCMTEFQDRETFQRIANIKQITMEYAKSGWLFIDFVATFPFNLIISGAFVTRLLRLMRLSKLVKVFDVSRIKRLIKNYFDKSNRADRVQT